MEMTLFFVGLSSNEQTEVRVENDQRTPGSGGAYMQLNQQSKNTSKFILVLDS